MQSYTVSWPTLDCLNSTTLGFKACKGNLHFCVLCTPPWSDYAASLHGTHLASQAAVRTITRLLLLKTSVCPTSAERGAVCCYFVSVYNDLSAAPLSAAICERWLLLSFHTYIYEPQNQARVSRSGLAVRLYRLVSGRTSVRHRFGSPFTSKKLWFVDAVLWLCPSLPTETLKWLSSLPILMQESFWWWQCSDSIISLFPPPHTPPPHPLLPFPNKPYGFCGR